MHQSMGLLDQCVLTCLRVELRGLQVFNLSKRLSEGNFGILRQEP